MEITITLDDKADVTFFKKMLLQLKGVKSVEISQNEMSDEKYNNLLERVLEKSIQQAENGKTTKLTPELLKDIFK